MNPSKPVFGILVQCGVAFGRDGHVRFSPVRERRKDKEKVGLLPVQNWYSTPRIYKELTYALMMQALM